MTLHKPQTHNLSMPSIKLTVGVSIHRAFLLHPSVNRYSYDVYLNELHLARKNGSKLKDEASSFWLEIIGPRAKNLSRYWYVTLQHCVGRLRQGKFL